MLKLELTADQVNIIGKALGAQPFDLVAPLIAELQKQINPQLQQQQAAQQPPGGQWVNGQGQATIHLPSDPN